MIKEITSQEILDVLNKKITDLFLSSKEVYYETSITNLSDIGLDSVDFTELLMEIEIHYQIVIPNEKFTTIGEIVDFVYDKIN